MPTPSWIRKVFTKTFSTRKASKIASQAHLHLITLEDRIVPAVPFSPAFPHALSINAPGSSVTTSASFTVTFNQPVIGVDASDFALIPTGTVANGSISSVTGSGASYTVNVTGITGNGSLGLNLVDLPTITALPSFANQQTFATGTNPISVTLGDVNGDGRLDIITANFSSNNASVLLGNGNGTFQGKQTFTTGTRPTSVTLGDVNGDGKLDIITANTFYGTTGVLLGNGNGTFQGQKTFATGTTPYSVTLGDVNGDGRLDIITANSNSPTVSVLLGNGNGTFQDQKTFATRTGTTPKSVTLGDVNGDGRLDIITANGISRTVSVLLGNGDGTFQDQKTFATGINPNSVTLGDVNGDGRLDIITASSGSNTVSVLLGNGNGTFQDQAQQTFTKGSNPISVTLGDVNGDGRLDIITANYYSSTAGVLLGNGNGTFQAQQNFTTGTQPRSVTLGDVNGDGRLDIITANTSSSTASVLLGTGGSAITATFSPRQTFATGDNPNSVTLGDVNGDGRLDIITANFGSNNASVLLGNGNGTFFQSQQTFPTGSFPSSVTLGDVNGDGRLDIITANTNPSTASVLLGNGNGTFQAQQNFTTGSYPRSVTLGDVNGDGRLDIITANQFSNNAGVLLGNGDGNFHAQQTFATGTQPTSVTLGDVNGDGRLDIITANFYSSTASVLLGNGNGTFQAQQNFTTGTGSFPTSVTLGDVNGDGRLDIITANAGSNTASVLLGNGNGTFQAQQNFTTGTQPRSVTLGDVNGDGRLDIITANKGSKNASVLLGNGNGTFQGRQTFATGDNPSFVTLGDVNGDGRLDIITANSGSSNASVLLNSLAFTGQTYNVANSVPLVTSSAAPNGNNPANLGTAVTLFDPATGQPTGSVVPFPGFEGQIRVVAGDFNQDGTVEIVAAAGPGGGPAVTIMDAKTGAVMAAFFAFDPAFTGGVFVAVQDVNNDGVADIITGAGAGGGPHVNIFNGATLQVIRSFFAFDSRFTGGVSVASADINRDGIQDFVTGAGPGGSPHMRVFDGATLSILSQWFAYPVNFTGGVFVAMSDIGNDGNFEVVTGAGQGGGPVVAIWDPFNGTLLAQFLAYSEAFTGGVRVGISDANDDGINDLVTGAGPGGAPQVNVYNFPQLDLLFSFLSGPVSDTTGVFVS